MIRHGSVKVGRRQLATGALALCICGAAVGCGAVLRPPDPNRRLELVTRGSMFETSNGYKFVVLDDAKVDLVRIDVRYPVGSADDPIGKEGLAHLVEHLLFEVSVPRPSGPTTIMAEFGKLATSTNAETTPDYTHYLTEGPADQLEALLMLETERLLVGCKGLTPEVFEREREVVLNELRQRRGAGGGELMQTLYRAVYPDGHAYRRLDSLESVSRLTLDDACTFIGERYRKGPAIVVLSGKLDDAAARYAVGGTLTRLPPRDVGYPEFPAEVAPRGGRTRIPANVKATTVVAAWPLPARHRKEYRFLEGYERAIANGVATFAARYGWGHSASYEVIGGDHAPIAIVSVSVNDDGKIDDAIEAIEKSVRAAMPSERAEKGERYWEPTALELLSEYESIGGRAALFMDFVANDPSGGFLAGRVEELRKVPAGELIALPRTWFDFKRAQVLVLDPAETQADAALGRGMGGAHDPRPGQVDGGLADREVERKPPDSLTFTSDRHTTGNGMRVLLWSAGQIPLVRGNLVIAAGTAHEPSDGVGLARFQRATSARVDTLSFRDAELSIRVDELIHSLGLYLRAPGSWFSDEYRERLQASLRRDDEQAWLDHIAKVDGALYGSEHPYARRGPTPEALESISLDRIKSWGRSHVVPANATLVLAGQFDADLIKKHIAYQTDQVSKGSVSPPIESPTRRWGATVATATETPMTTIRLHAAFVGAAGVDRDEARRRILREVLVERLGELRETLGVTYGFDAGYEHLAAGGQWWIGGEADAARAGEAAVAFVKILSEVRGDVEKNRRAFVLARQRVLDRLATTTATSESMLSWLSFLARFDLGDDYLLGLYREVAATTLPSFQAFVERELASDRQVLSIFGNEAAVRAAREAKDEVPTVTVAPAVGTSR